MQSYSQIKDQSRVDEIPCIEREELFLGELLGKGGFNQVFAVERIGLLKKRGRYPHKTSSKTQRQNRSLLAENSEDNYAVKFLKREVMASAKDYSNGAADLMVETQILSTIKSHPNIITLHGVAAAGVSGFAEGTEGGYFLILDRLTDTLDNRLATWKTKKVNLFERTKVAFNLASAVNHLHEYNIVFRDLKPDNVGFDANGTLKLFDFGLAKELNPRERVADDTYKMSGNTGTRRYMAPEVVLNKPYGLSADVYSFGVLLWEICSLTESFEGMKLKEHLNDVVKGDVRPKLNSKWSETLQNIMKWSWMPEQGVRPPMLEIRRALKTELRAQSSKFKFIKDLSAKKNDDKLSRTQSTPMSALSALTQGYNTSHGNLSSPELDLQTGSISFDLDTQTVSIKTPLRNSLLPHVA